MPLKLLQTTNKGAIQKRLVVSFSFDTFHLMAIYHKRNRSFEIELGVYGSLIELRFVLD